MFTKTFKCTDTAIIYYYNIIMFTMLGFMCKAYYAQRTTMAAHQRFEGHEQGAGTAELERRVAQLKREAQKLRAIPVPRISGVPGHK